MLKSLTISDREEREMMIDKIEYLDSQYKKLFDNYRHNNKKTVTLTDENDKLKSKYQKLKQEREEQDRRIRELTEELARTSQR